MRANDLQSALGKLAEAIRETEAVLESMRSEHDPLAAHIFVSRRHYRNMPDTKSGSRREVAARLSWQTACELGFRGTLIEWERLMGAAAKRWIERHFKLAKNCPADVSRERELLRMLHKSRNSKKEINVLR